MSDLEKRFNETLDLFVKGYERLQEATGITDSSQLLAMTHGVLMEAKSSCGWSPFAQMRSADGVSERSELVKEIAKAVAEEMANKSHAK